MPARPGAHELGQNHLVDPRAVTKIVTLVADRRLPLLEWAAGRGALTRELAALGRPLEAVEIDPHAVAALRRRVGPHVAITHGDILRHAPPQHPHDLVSNLPFHLTTPALRRLLGLDHWQRAVLLTQWEVARKRAAVGGTTLLTAQWWPWFAFELAGRVPASAFAPRPTVDGGILVIDRRTRPSLPPVRRGAYQRWVAAVFAARGRGIAAMLRAADHSGSQDRRSRNDRSRVDHALRDVGVAPSRLPRDLTAEQWASLFSRLGPAPQRPAPARRRPPRGSQRSRER